MKVRGNEKSDVKRFKYLVSVLQNIGGCVEDIKPRIRCEWMRWRET